MRTIQRDIASAVLVSSDQKIFLAKKKSGGVFAGTWTIPGGGIDAGEARETAVVREVMEETGINISGYDAELVDIGHGRSEKTLRDTAERVIAEMTLYDFRVMLDRAATDVLVNIQDEFDEYRWFARGEITSITLSPSCEKLFRKLGYL